MTITFKQFISEALNFRDLYTGEFTEEQQQMFLSRMHKMQLDTRKYVEIYDMHDFGSTDGSTKLRIDIDWAVDPKFFMMYDLLDANNKKEALKILGSLVKDTNTEFKKKLGDIDLATKKFEVFIGPTLKQALTKTTFRPDFADYIAKSSARQYHMLNDLDVKHINSLSGDEQRRAMDKFANDIQTTFSNIAKVSGKR